MPSLLPPALSQLSGQFCQGRILPSDHPVTRDHWPSSLCVRFQAISRGGIVNGQVSQLWRISSSQYLLFGAVKWSNINHKLFIEIDSECSQITDHPGVRGRCLNITDTVSRLDTRVSVSGVWWSLCIIGHCHQESLFPITMLFLMLSHSPPPISWSLPVPRFAPLGSWRRSPLTWVRHQTQNPTVPRRTLQI